MDAGKSADLADVAGRAMGFFAGDWGYLFHRIYRFLAAGGSADRQQRDFADRGITGNVRAMTHAAQLHYLPTLLWLNWSDAFIHAICLSGCIAAALLILNILPLGATTIAWMLYCPW